MFFILCKIIQHKRPKSTQCIQARYKWHDRSRGKRWSGCRWYICIYLYVETFTDRKKNIYKEKTNDSSYYIAFTNPSALPNASFTLRIQTHTHTHSHAHAHLRNSCGSKCAKSLVKILHRNLPPPLLTHPSNHHPVRDERVISRMKTKWLTFENTDKCNTLIHLSPKKKLESSAD